MEIFKPVIGFDGYYEISNFGNLRSVDRLMKTRWGGEIPIKGKLISIKIDRYGYHKAVLFRDGLKTHTTIHRIVAKNFILNPENKTDVNHINGIKTDNRVENLEWATISENIIHSYKILGRKGNITTARPVKQIHNGEVISIYPSAVMAAKTVNGNACAISHVVNGRSKTSSGYKWEYA